MAKIPKNLSDKDMFQNYKEEETLESVFLSAEAADDRKRREARRPAEDLSIALLETAHAADLNAIVRVVERELIWRVPREGAFLITIDHRKISVEGFSSPGGAPASAPIASHAAT